MYEMSRSEALEFLAGQQVAHLAVIDGDDPYVSPVSFVVEDDTLYFRTRPGRRLRALSATPRICAEASETDPQSQTWTSVCMWGDAHLVEDVDAQGLVVGLLLEKYAAEGESILSFAKAEGLGSEAAVVAVPIGVISGRRSGPELGAHIRPGRL